jgi:hypothetical protein
LSIVQQSKPRAQNQSITEDQGRPGTLKSNVGCEAIDVRKGPIADQIGGTNTLLGVGIVIAGVALLSITRGPKRHTAQES